MRAIRTLALILLLLSALTVKAQGPFKQYYDVTGDVFTKGLHSNTRDSGMILITRSTNVTGTKYFTVFKTLANGDVQWSSRFIQPGNCGVSNIVELADSGFFFCFVELNYPEKYYITKLDRYGNLVYCRSLTPPPNFIVAFDPQCIAKRDGGVYVASDLHNLANSMFGWHLFEIDAGGNIVFSQCYNGGTLKCLERSFMQCQNGDLVMTGYQRDSLLLHFGPMITRIDSDGVFLWSKLFIDTTTDIAGISIVELQNGDLAVAASHTTPGNELIRLQTDAAGNFIRVNEYGNAAHSLTPVTAMRGENSSMIIFGTSDSGSFAVKIDSLGIPVHASRFLWVSPNKVQRNPVSGYSFGGIDPTSNHAVIFTTDSTLTSCFGTPLQIDTTSISFLAINAGMQYAVALYDTAFNLQTNATPGSNIKNCGPIGIDEREPVDFKIYPNPAHDAVQIHCDETILIIELYDLRGCVLDRAEVNSTDYTQALPPLPGLYLVRIQTETSVQSVHIVAE